MRSFDTRFWNSKKVSHKPTLKRQKPLSQKLIVRNSRFHEFWNSWTGFDYVEECMTVNWFVEDLAIS